jgi:hypothetical protein
MLLLLHRSLLTLLFFDERGDRQYGTNLITLKTEYLVERNRHCVQKSYRLHFFDPSISTHSQRLPQMEP